jgi:hypothetical protein
MDASATSERAELINRVIGANTFDEINEARQALMGYLQAHPDDQGIEELKEHLLRLGKELGKQSATATSYLTTEPNQPG